jgi:hypothetical protein
MWVSWPSAWLIMVWLHQSSVLQPGCLTWYVINVYWMAGIHGSCTISKRCCSVQPHPQNVWWAAWAPLRWHHHVHWGKHGPVQCAPGVFAVGMHEWKDTMVWQVVQYAYILYVWWLSRLTRTTMLASWGQWCTTILHILFKTMCGISDKLLQAYFKHTISVATRSSKLIETTTSASLWWKMKIFSLALLCHWALGEAWDWTLQHQSRVMLVFVLHYAFIYIIFITHCTQCTITDDLSNSCM